MAGGIIAITVLSLLVLVLSQCFHCWRWCYHSAVTAGAGAITVLSLLVLTHVPTLLVLTHVLIVLV